MKNPKPIKRHPSLKPISRQHHFGLLFSWKIKKGLSKGISKDRLVAYRNWFYKTEILPHFEIEEKYLFTVLDDDNPLVECALKEHQQLRELFQAKNDVLESLKLLEKELTAHIRFEERILFNEIEKEAQPEELNLIDRIHIHDAAKSEEYHDTFWL